jgi:predicted Abi (CAAX) family protease
MQGKQSEIKPRVNKARKLRFWSFLLLLIVSAIAIFLFYPRPQQVVKRESNYAIHRRQEFNQPEFYPVNTNENLKLYRPVGEWVGKLILPTKEQMQAKSDWSWLLVQHAPAQAQNLIGQVVRLEWKNKPELNSYVKTTTRNVRFTPGTIKSQNKGIVHPNRLDGRLGVGPLQSLAGAKPNDDMIVTLDSADVVAGSDGKPVLQIEQEPTQATGRFYA